MALRGSLADFGISEILQMIGHQNKSGTMEVLGKGKTVKILFDSGAIVFAEAQPATAEFELSSILTKSKLITPSQMEVARRQAQENLQPVEVILLNSKAITLEDLRQMINLKNLEIIYDLFLWDEGDYSFDQGPVNYPKQLTQPIDCEQVLMDGYRVKDEWPEVRKWVGDLNVRLEKVPESQAREDLLKADTLPIYHLVNGERTALDIAFLCRMGRFETAKTLGRLIEQQYVRPVLEELSALEEKPMGLRLTIPVYILFAVLAILFLIGVSRNLIKLINLSKGPTGISAELVENMEMLRLKYALELYYDLHGNYPERLEDLSKEKILQQKENIGPWGAPYIYGRKEKGYLLESPVKSGPSRSGN